MPSAGPTCAEHVWRGDMTFTTFYSAFRRRAQPSMTNSAMATSRTSFSLSIEEITTFAMLPAVRRLRVHRRVMKARTLDMICKRLLGGDTSRFLRGNRKVRQGIDRSRGPRVGH